MRVRARLRLSRVRLSRVGALGLRGVEPDRAITNPGSGFPGPSCSQLCCRFEASSYILWVRSRFGPDQVGLRIQLRFRLRPRLRPRLTLTLMLALRLTFRLRLQLRLTLRLTLQLTLQLTLRLTLRVTRQLRARLRALIRKRHGKNAWVQLAVVAAPSVGAPKLEVSGMSGMAGMRLAGGRVEGKGLFWKRPVWGACWQCLWAWRSLRDLGIRVRVRVRREC